jgi:catechol 2,3-dioxygenase-like lactoylglutathione lyase family enzyme
MSLAVKDIRASQEFYAKLGFEEAGGDIEQNWLILRNGDHVIGLFQGMFEKNTLTFNPGWDQQCNNLDSFTNVRDIQGVLKAAGVEIAVTADEASQGPASFCVIDPDGNPVLFDQHR